MNCMKVNSLLIAYYEKDLTTEEEKSIAAHLRSCNECKRALEEIIKVVEGLRANKLKEPGKEFWDALSLKVMDNLFKGAPSKKHNKINLKESAKLWIKGLFIIKRFQYAAVLTSVFLLIISIFFLNKEISIIERESKVKMFRQLLSQFKGKNITDVVFLENFSPEFIKDILTREEYESPGDFSFFELDELYNQLIVTLENKGSIIEDEFNGEGGVLNDYGYAEIDQIEKKEIKFILEELKLKYNRIENLKLKI
ncbi:MAG: hypothetical protein SV062_11535 [Thermodesulfobacteriota bacterium]|nr:hypothetical protein [Thermodesulfobacteriota bacterium]